MQLIGKNKNSAIELDFYTENPEGIIDELNSNGYECEYWTNGITGKLTYPNYKDADEIACNWVGVETMQYWFLDWEYLDNKLTK
tara:strand:+ start:2525 stop:2776 length:252 start_codon:yes stop_codon:yes gene_type:complete